LFEIVVDEKEVKDIVKEQISKKLDGMDLDLVFWDRKELMRRSCLSWNSIQKYFFSDPRFPKHKIGYKWYFPAEETKIFLLMWLGEQPKS
jgi:hypothetical protein